MARITVQDCLKAGYNKFALVHLAAKRVFQIKKGREPLVSTSNREVVTALREIAANKVRRREAESLPKEDLTGEDEGTAAETSNEEDSTEVSSTENPADEPR